MNKLRDRLHTGMGVISMGGVLAASLGGALIDRALHPADSYRDIRKCRAATRSPASESSIQPYSNHNSLTEDFGIGEFLNPRPDIEPDGIDDMTQTTQG
jgi:hypothetical protein